MPEVKEIIIESKKHGTVTVLLDQEDWDKVKDYKWHLSSDGYVRAKIKDPKGRTRIKNGYVCAKHADVHMHRLILGTPKGLQTDHINGNTTDNRKSNLRVCNESQNARNRRPRKDNKAGLKGVSAQPLSKRNPWRAKIRIEGKRIYLGCFATAEEAGRAYDKRAKEEWGEFAYLNFPDEV